MKAQEGSSSLGIQEMTLLASREKEASKGLCASAPLTPYSPGAGTFTTGKETISERPLRPGKHLPQGCILASVTSKSGTLLVLRPRSVTWLLSGNRNFLIPRHLTLVKDNTFLVEATVPVHSDPLQQGISWSSEGCGQQRLFQLNLTKAVRYCWKLFTQLSAF